MRRIGEWIQTYTGRKFYPLDPRPEDICLIDIAHALSLQCRFNGHCKTFYSVAEHCVRMAGMPKIQIPAIVGDVPQVWYLLHDAAEAYLADVPKPIKPYLSGFSEAEEKILKCVQEFFNLPPFPKGSIKIMDEIMLSTERRDVLPTWIMWEGTLLPPLKETIIPWSCKDAEFVFMQTFMNNR
jgi:hypothetical protein